MARRQFRSRSPETVVEWQFSEVSSLAQSAGVVAVLYLTANHPITVLRIRGEFVVYLDGTQTPGALVSIQAGLIHRRSGARSTAVAEPRAESETRWLWYNTTILGYEEQVTDVIDAPVLTAVRVHVDNKAMLKMKSEDELQFVITNSTLGNAASINAVFSGRLLSKVP